jgi:hypothetical protein
MVKLCTFCQKTIEPHVNYCNWECHIAEAKKAGGRVITPNNLPISCIKFDGTMLEHEHGDHPDYKFPVTVEYQGKLPEGLAEWDCSYKPECHALIYCDGYIAVTLYEHTYGVFSLSDGGSITNKSWYKDWHLTQSSIDEIRKRYK